jgi:hypothetical protein
MVRNCYNICYSAPSTHTQKNRVQRLMTNYFGLTQHMTFATTRFNRGAVRVYVCECVIQVIRINYQHIHTAYEALCSTTKEP